MNEPQIDPSKPTRNRPVEQEKLASEDAALWQRQAARNGLIGLILALGASLTVALSYANIGSMRMHVAIAVLIAMVQAGCVAMISMHLKSEQETISRPMLLTLVVVAALLGLSMLGLADHAHY